MKAQLVFFAAVFSILLNGQINLVLNPIFEDTLRCPADSAVIKARIWFNPTCGSPDYFYPTVQGNPLCLSQFPAHWGGGSYVNNWGYSLPRTGTAYAGMGVVQGDEFIAGKLSDSLKAGKKYAISFYTSLSELYYSQGAEGLDLIAIGFMNDSVTDYSINCWQYLGTLQADAGNQSGNFLTDTSGWMVIRDTFIAEGGERYFVLGNIDTANTQYVNSPTPTPCYYYFDDFDVHCIDCTSDTSEPPVFPVITISPTLTQGEITLSGDFPAGTKLEVYDVLGQLVYHDELQSGNQTQTVFLQLSAGVYTCRVMAEGNVLKTEKVVLAK